MGLTINEAAFVDVVQVVRQPMSDYLPSVTNLTPEWWWVGRGVRHVLLSLFQKP